MPDLIRGAVVVVEPIFPRGRGRGLRRSLAVHRRRYPERAKLGALEDLTRLHAAIRAPEFNPMEASDGDKGHDGKIRSRSQASKEAAHSLRL